MYYNTEERVQIINWYMSGNSTRGVRDLFSVAYPSRQVPSMGTIVNIVHHFDNTGCVSNFHIKRAKGTHILTEEMKLNILCYVEQNSISSLRVIAAQFQISSASVYKTLKEFKYNAYKFSNHQQLSNEDKGKRTEFCETLFNLINNDEEMLHKIVFTDEASFYLNGEVNPQNYRFGACNNPHLQNLTHTQYNARVNVWAGLINDTLIGPFIINGNLNSNVYLDLLRTRIMPGIQALNISAPYYQMDGAPPHSTAANSNYLNELLPDRWIGRFGPIPWPPQSPDLSPYDFFLWGYLKYGQKIIHRHSSMDREIDIQ